MNSNKPSGATVVALLLLLAGTTFAADNPPSADLALLKTFRSEFIEIRPGDGRFPSTYQTTRQGRSRTVSIQHRFAISKYEVPQNLYESIVGENPSRWKGPRNSAEMFDWNQAVEFCKKVTQRLRAAGLIGENEEIRLPTEDEWEFCCRAGTQTAYSFGDDPAKLGEYAWYRGNAAGNDPPVGALKPNPWGLYDVHGYLWEWCQDAVGGDGRVLRGGAWTSTAEECRSDGRLVVKADAKGPDVGLRCVLAEAKPAGDE